MAAPAYAEHAASALAVVRPAALEAQLGAAYGAPESPRAPGPATGRMLARLLPSGGFRLLLHIAS